MFADKHYILLTLFVVLLTVVMYGIMRAVIKTAFGQDISPKTTVNLGFNKYLPQTLLIGLVLILGLCCPQWLGGLLMEASSWM